MHFWVPYRIVKMWEGHGASRPNKHLEHRNLHAVRAASLSLKPASYSFLASFILLHYRQDHRQLPSFKSFIIQWNNMWPWVLDSKLPGWTLIRLLRSMFPLHQQTKAKAIKDKKAFHRVPRGGFMQLTRNTVPPAPSTPVHWGTVYPREVHWRPGRRTGGIISSRWLPDAEQVKISHASWFTSFPLWKLFYQKFLAFDNLTSLAFLLG